MIQEFSNITEGGIEYRYVVGDTIEELMATGIPRVRVQSQPYFRREMLADLTKMGVSWIDGSSGSGLRTNLYLRAPSLEQWDACPAWLKDSLVLPYLTLPTCPESDLSKNGQLLLFSIISHEDDSDQYANRF